MGNQLRNILVIGLNLVCVARIPCRNDPFLKKKYQIFPRAGPFIDCRVLNWRQTVRSNLLVLPGRQVISAIWSDFRVMAVIIKGSRFAIVANFALKGGINDF